MDDFAFAFLDPGTGVRLQLADKRETEASTPRPSFEDQMAGLSPEGILKQALRTFKADDPERQVQKNFEDTTMRLLRNTKILHQQNQELTQLRYLLLSMLINGQVTVG